MEKKYGEDFEYINGVHPNQLDFSEFLEHFVEHDTMADSTIDPNANANHKDIRSFMTEKGKSEDIVIYTGYNESEIADEVDIIRKHKNIIVKFGRYRPSDTGKYDEVLGVNLASRNQYAKKIS